MLMDGTGFALCDKFMVTPASLFRIILATLVCAGFCGLNWNQLIDPPEEHPRELVLQVFADGGCPVFALGQETAHPHAAQPDREEIVPFVFGLLTQISLTPPEFYPVGSVSFPVAKAQGVLKDKIKNRDPPVS